MSKISQIIRQFENKKKELELKNNQRNDLVKFIDTLEHRRNNESILS